MRKYFESIDLKSISDPSLPLKQTTGEVGNNTQVLPQQPVLGSNPTPAPTPAPTPTPTPEISKDSSSEMEAIEKGTDLDNPMDSVMKSFCQ